MCRSGLGVVEHYLLCDQTVEGNIVIPVDEKNLRNIVSIVFIGSMELTENEPLAVSKLKFSPITNSIK